MSIDREEMIKALFEHAAALESATIYECHHKRAMSSPKLRAHCRATLRRVCRLLGIKLTPEELAILSDPEELTMVDRVEGQSGLVKRHPEMIQRLRGD